MDNLWIISKMSKKCTQYPVEMAMKWYLGMFGCLYHSATFLWMFHGHLNRRSNLHADSVRVQFSGGKSFWKPLDAGVPQHIPYPHKPLITLDTWLATHDIFHSFLVHHECLLLKSQVLRDDTYT